MKHRIILLSIILFHFNLSYGQAPAWDWVINAGGEGNDEGLSTTSDKNGAIIVAGCYHGPITLGGTILPSYGGSYDFFIAKYDSIGNLLWAKSGGGSNADQIVSVTTDPWGNIVVAGGFQSHSMKIGTFTLSNSGSWDTFVAKFDPQGNVLWAKQLICPDHDYASAVIADSTSIVIGGNFKDNVFFKADTLKNVSSETNSFDVFLIKYDSDGNYIWSKSMGGTKNDSMEGLSLGKDGDIFATGTYSISPITFGNTTLSNTGFKNIFLTKFNHSGDVIWAKKAAGTSADYVTSIVADQNQNPIISGYFSSDKLFFGTDSLTKIGATTYHTFLAKYDNDGNVIWLRRTGNKSMTVAYASCIDRNNNILIAGNYINHNLTFGGDTLVNKGTWDIFLLKYDELGNELWAKGVGGENYDEVASNCVSVTPNGAVLLTGWFYSDSIVLDSTTLVNTVVGHPTSNNRDLFFAVLSHKTKTSVVSIPETSPDAVIVFPNPTNGTLNISSANPIRQIQIFSSTGQPIVTEKVNMQHNFMTTLDRDGVYFIQIITDKQITVKKIIVSKEAITP